MPNQIWKTTAIYKKLETLQGEYPQKMIAFLEQPSVMDGIESVLNSAGTTPKDFTLHDATHSFRVAERMWNIIPDITKEVLSAYELGLLLLSAYLHDIGMSPEHQKVEAHRIFLTSRENANLSEEEKNEFQKFIDNDADIIPMDIRVDKITDLKKSNYILSYYIRYKHNDWSAEWITTHLSQLSLHNYPNWSEDLIYVCKSHHYGLEYLKVDRFEPKPLEDSIIVHLRYLAMCLRVADVMENDPERTPEIILKHRLINSKSVSYWLKDHQFTLTSDNGNYTAHARPDKAYLHKAILQSVDWIEDEFRLCNDLIKSKPLQHSSFRQLEGYEWNLPSAIYRDIKPKDGSYEFIEGTFRPNTAKILELLGGTQLYGNVIWGFRELLQNAFDAVKENIGYKVIAAAKNPEEYLKRYRELHTIDIEIEEREDGHWLICADQGVGMTKYIIEKFFLESGSSQRYEINKLERECKAKGFNLGRTGQFGIGVLSYFMLAEKIVVYTKRELNTGYTDEESIAWRFEINGAHDFGELSRVKQPTNGTTIELKLNKNIDQDIESWKEKFVSFLKDEICVAPCLISFVTPGENAITVNPGWNATVEDIKQKLYDSYISQIENPYSSRRKSFLSSEEKEQQKNNEDMVKNDAAEMRRSVDFLFEEFQIENYGKVRIFVPYFKLTKGNSFYYAKEENSPGYHRLIKTFSGYIWEPWFYKIYLSLKGIRIEGGIFDGSENYDIEDDEISVRSSYSNCHIEVDLEEVNKDSLAVSRHKLTLNEAFKTVIEEIEQKIDQLLQNERSKFDNSYGTLNFKCSEHMPSELNWGFTDTESNSLLWRNITAPLIIVRPYSKEKQLQASNPEIEIIQQIKSTEMSGSFDFLNVDSVTYQHYLTLKGTGDTIHRGLMEVVGELGNIQASSFHFPTIKTFDFFADVALFNPLSFRNAAILLNMDYVHTNKANSKIFKNLHFGNLESFLSKPIDPAHYYTLLISLLATDYGQLWPGFCAAQSSLVEKIFNHLKINEIKAVSGSFYQIYTMETLNEIPLNDILLKNEGTIDSKLILTENR
ncbi:MAG: hypothetical protein V4687_00960 [Bacteroidota bacterium]